MKALFGTQLFTAGARSYYWEDVFVAARLWSDWAALQKQVREGIACTKRLAGDKDLLDPGELKSAANDFRYQRKLLSAEEAESWLKKRDLTVEMWTEYIQRTVLRRKWAADLDDIVARYAVTEDEIDEAATCEAICSERLTALAHKLAGRAAVFARAETQPEHPAPDARPRPSDHEHIASAFAKLAVPGFPLEYWQERVDWLARVEEAFPPFCAHPVMPDALADEVGAHHFDWIVVDYRFAPFRDEETAREAALCIREDGAGLAELAGRAGSAEDGGRVLLEQAEPELRPYLLGARKGETLGPLRWRDQFVIVQVLEKTLPSVDEPQVRERASEAALSSRIEREVLDRVRWAAGGAP